jgi:hypothetical protein
MINDSYKTPTSAKVIIGLLVLVILILAKMQFMPSKKPIVEASAHQIEWANGGPLVDRAIRFIELGFRDDHIVVWRLQPPEPTPTPPPEQTTPVEPGPTTPPAP